MFWKFWKGNISKTTPRIVRKFFCNINLHWATFWPIFIEIQGKKFFSIKKCSKFFIDFGPRDRQKWILHAEKPIKSSFWQLQLRSVEIYCILCRKFIVRRGSANLSRGVHIYWKIMTGECIFLGVIILSYTWCTWTMGVASWFTRGILWTVCQPRNSLFSRKFPDY